MNDQPPEQQLEYIIEAILTKTIRVLQILIPLIARFSSQHPTAFLVLTCAILVFILLRIIRNMVTIVRRTLFLGVLVFVVLLYVRGFDTVVLYDLPFLYKLVLQDENLETIIRKWSTYLSHSSIRHSRTIYSICRHKAMEVWNQLISALNS
ncbi:APQ12 (YIL040W) [Zygosaccharomyces parabailii]|uniref:BN860_01860g1_1 n=1 Tax=Zygosaccharomyces bailii (strain CLIB 213 / ATCC 58445 / CBS 680 / BCRC 21525 / NBRC 1098 / NCYC 1416 / NRRL Y-2227) TaxID=1333698 RepID=A0A8J2T6J1_ZYGB2|nr:APQ12 (YIL040W) [Zygosaccharomyces parabailii]CDF88080.1 BN860_01860g1_1 [Zygosaccharomyces bailii CLIB 213]CDH09090.1 uncharacterized protein ZBAI_00874 [Zygosaccharomyces bailii ISA1307]SJM87389.1 uncharacterized protein ZBIST_3578 [Zygosaccharomyces bailii]